MLGVGAIRDDKQLAGVRCGKIRSNQSETTNSWRVLGGTRWRVLGVGAIRDDKQLAGVRCRNNRRRQTAGGC